MTREEFNSTRFGAMTMVSHKGRVYQVVMVDFEEAILGIDMFEDIDNLSYVRCESVELT